MNERLPDSSGLPLRAMVMVLLFLGVIFLLVGFQAMRPTGSADEETHMTLTMTTTTSPSPTQRPITEQADVRVYNVSDLEGVAARTADELKSAGWNVTEVDNLSLPDVTETTVYFGDAAGEREAAEAVGGLLDAPVEPRPPDIAQYPPGVMVVVAS
jgi:cell division protein FtsX